MRLNSPLIFSVFCLKNQLLRNFIYRITNQSEDQLLGWQVFNALKLGSAFFVSVILAKIHGNIAFISRYENLLLISSLFSFFYVSGISHVFPSFFESQNHDQFKLATSQLFWALQIGGLFSALGGLVYMAVSFNAPHYWFFLPFLLLNPAAFALEGLLLVKRKTESLFWYGIISYSTYVIGVGLVYYWSNDIGILILFMSVWAVLRWGYTLWKIRPKWISNCGSFGPLLKRASPVMISMLIGGSYVYLNALIVEQQLSEEDFVLFRYGAREFPLFLIIANSFSTIYSAKIAGNKSLAESLKEFSQKNARIMHQLFPTAIVLMLASPFLFRWVYNPTIAPAAFVFNILLFLLSSRVLFPQTILLGLNKNRRFVNASLIELLSGVILSLLFIGPFGIEGASWAMVLAFMAEKVFLIYECYRRKIHFFQFFPWKLYLLYQVLLAAAFVQSIAFIN